MDKFQRLSELFPKANVKGKLNEQDYRNIEEELGIDERDLVEIIEWFDEQVNKQISLGLEKTWLNKWIEIEDGWDFVEFWASFCGRWADLEEMEEYYDEEEISYSEHFFNRNDLFVTSLGLLWSVGFMEIV